MYQVDVWGGDLHQNHSDTQSFEDWAEASRFMASRVESGLLCNVLHTDFKAPPERVNEAEAALANYLTAPDADRRR